MRLQAGAFAWLPLGALGGEVLLQDPVPLTEYYSRTLKDYSGLSWETITPDNAAPMVRVKNLEDSEFRDLVRRGYPFIVDDCAPLDAELASYPCSEFGLRWPNEHMRAEYTPDQHHIFLKDPEWYSVQKPTAKAKKHLSRGKPLSGPYIWHVKDETEDRQTKRDLMEVFPVPYFLNSSALNANEARDSFEFWFVLENGGSQAHADAYCETTISLQLRGHKRWRLGAFPNITNAFQPYAFHDSEIYRHDKLWRPEHEELVGPGQCVVFPMGYIHETYVSEGMAGEDGCSVATTFQFQDPQPVHQWKNFLARWGLSHYSRDEPCLERMEPYVFLGGRVKASGKGDREAALREKCSKVFAAADSDGDGSVTTEELMWVYGRMGFQPPWTEARSPALLRQAAEEKARWMAEDAVLYHDENRDGVVSLAELEDSVLKFDAVKSRLKTIKSTKSASKLHTSERTWIQKHMCAAQQDCPLLDQLDRDYQARGKRASRQSEL